MNDRERHGSCLAVGARPRRRGAAVLGLALIALAPLLTGCGGGDSHDGAAGKPGTKPLTRTQVKSIVPDAAAMPGWRTSGAAVAGPVAEGRQSGAIRCDRPTGGFCGDATSYARADFSGEKRPQISFSVLAYKDTDTARARYPRILRKYKDSFVQARDVNVGLIGDQRAARMGYGARMTATSRGGFAVVRVGQVIVLASGDGGEQTMTSAVLTEIATLVARRAEQAEDQGMAWQRLPSPSPTTSPGN
ncbi:hypothetical protein ACIBL6_46260 [Streptomyces sp. NPDC050400]|uniref:hypothetical protein n=1 Tax=Streptomyces sp. NPDC050400 TaxID=3365610 RepID=UPI0037B06350